MIVADEQLHTPHYEVTRLRENELGEETSAPSYQRGTPRKVATIALSKAQLNIPPAPAVTKVKPAQPAPLARPEADAGRTGSAGARRRSRTDAGSGRWRDRLAARLVRRLAGTGRHEPSQHTTDGDEWKP